MNNNFGDYGQIFEYVLEYGFMVIIMVLMRIIDYVDRLLIVRRFEGRQRISLLRSHLRLRFTAYSSSSLCFRRCMCNFCGRNS